ncbi:hypothetical protein [Amorphus coralli]|uniref:hypothetical protein n=1 Tax=Amorphus coralli TaxID=340680 RepID=UPI0003798592|nr:hypothetical protein [Amorphus coralli]
MSRVGARFSQVALKRALRSVSDAGIPLDRAEIDPDAKIVLVFGGQQQQTVEDRRWEEGTLDAEDAL